MPVYCDEKRCAGLVMAHIPVVCTVPDSSHVAVRAVYNMVMAT